jgi:hypothetical protein
MQKDQFQEHENFMNEMRNYFNNQRKQPQIGEYDVKYTEVDK